MRGYSVMLGLHKRERADTFTADGWYRTGDAGHFDADGHLFFAGRLGDVVKTSGMNVTPREVEAALEEQPEVALAIVTGIDHPDRGQDVVAAVALSPGASLDADEARERLRDRARRLQGAPPRRRVRQPGRPAPARLGQGGPAPAGADPGRTVRPGRHRRRGDPGAEEQAVTTARPRERPAGRRGHRRQQRDRPRGRPAAGRGRVRRGADRPPPGAAARGGRGDRRPVGGGRQRGARAVRGGGGRGRPRSTSSCTPPGSWTAPSSARRRSRASRRWCAPT